MKSLLLAMTVALSLAFAATTHADDKIETDVKEVSKKVTKRKGYCSPLDKMTGAKHCKDIETSDEKRVEKAEAKLKKIDKKVQKREDYCSPLDRATNKKGCVGQ